MNILYLSLGEFSELSSGSVHVDILKRLSKENNVFLVCKRERRNGKPTELSVEENINILRVKTGNIKNTNIIEKGISTVLIESQFKNAIKKYFSNVKFDLVLYETPPITFVSVVEYVKKRDNAKSYLMLKDIFPQNAVDLGMLDKNGIKGIIYKYFRKKEKKLYAVSDRIGCMSQANVDYVLKHNPEIDRSTVEICPNSIEISKYEISFEEKNAMRNKYGLPLDKRIFVYGGNLGKPQGIPFLIECLEKEKNNNDVFFLIVGNGNYFDDLQKYMHDKKPFNAKLMASLPREDYDKLVCACDIGMIFLDHRFTIPNFPSRILSYMQACLPVLACTDPNTDIGDVAVEGNFGWKCESNSTDEFHSCVMKAAEADLKKIGENGFDYLVNNYSVEKTYNIIMDFLV